MLTATAPEIKLRWGLPVAHIIFPKHVSMQCFSSLSAQAISQKHPWKSTCGGGCVCVLLLPRELLQLEFITAVLEAALHDAEVEVHVVHQQGLLPDRRERVVERDGVTERPEQLLPRRFRDAVPERAEQLLAGVHAAACSAGTAPCRWPPDAGRRGAAGVQGLRCRLYTIPAQVRLLGMYAAGCAVGAACARRWLEVSP